MNGQRTIECEAQVNELLPLQMTTKLNEKALKCKPSGFLRNSMRMQGMYAEICRLLVNYPEQAKGSL